MQISQQTGNSATAGSVQDQVNNMIEELISSLPAPTTLTSDERRGIIARYTAVLEGNFIYWMTAALIAVKTEEAREELLENLHEEVRDAHPVMLRRFAMAAHAFPTDTDAMAVNDDLNKVRVFLGRLSAVQSLVTMALFEGFIQRFMGYLASLATAEGSKEMEYTDVHGVCDIAHTEGLFRALSAENAVNPSQPGADLFEGANLLSNLVRRVVQLHPEPALA
jgi:DNA-binding Lrp family transcriptional regulator